MTIHTHTPTPWEVIWKTSVGNKEVVVADLDCLPNNDENEANAAFIVRACNAHYDLVEALEMLLQDCKEKGRSASYRQAESALKLARGE